MHRLVYYIVFVLCRLQISSVSDHNIFLQEERCYYYSSETGNMPQYILHTVAITDKHFYYIVCFFFRKVGIKVLGVVENMSGLKQKMSDLKFSRLSESRSEADVTEWALNLIHEKAPELLDAFVCSDIFDSSHGGAQKMCLEMGVPFLGKVPMDPQLCRAAEEGRSCFGDTSCSVSALALKGIIQKLIALE
jgi:NUBPL iron-transfer P-loop NTPase